MHRVHDGDRKTGERENQNREHGPAGNEARRAVDLGRGDVGERAAAVANRAEEHHHVVHAAGEHAADQDPEEPRHIAELRSENGPEKRTCGRDGGEVVPEEHVLVGRHEVLAVIVFDGGRFARGVDIEDFLSDEKPVEAIGDGEYAESRKDDRKRIHAGSWFHRDTRRESTRTARKGLCARGTIRSGWGARRFVRLVVECLRCSFSTRGSDRMQKNRRRPLEPAARRRRAHGAPTRSSEVRPGTSSPRFELIRQREKSGPEGRLSEGIRTFESLGAR